MSIYKAVSALTLELPPIETTYFGGALSYYQA